MENIDKENPYFKVNPYTKTVYINYMPIEKVKYSVWQLYKVK